jgi:hypothetical protein
MKDAPTNSALGLALKPIKHSLLSVQSNCAHSALLDHNLRRSCRLYLTEVGQQGVASGGGVGGGGGGRVTWRMSCTRQMLSLSKWSDSMPQPGGLAEGDRMEQGDPL